MNKFIQSQHKHFTLNNNKNSHANLDEFNFLIEKRGKLSMACLTCLYLNFFSHTPTNYHPTRKDIADSLCYARVKKELWPFN